MRKKWDANETRLRKLRAIGRWLQKMDGRVSYVRTVRWLYVELNAALERAAKAERRTSEAQSEVMRLQVKAGVWEAQAQVQVEVPGRGDARWLPLQQAVKQATEELGTSAPSLDLLNRATEILSGWRLSRPPAEK
jgi:hypothetical protein